MPTKLPPNSTRRDAFSAKPEDIWIAGIDGGDVTHILYDERVDLPIDPHWVEMIAQYGSDIIPPVTVRIGEGDRIELVYGRQRVKSARQANKLRATRGLPPISIRYELCRDKRLAYLAIQQLAENMRVNTSPRELGIHALKLKRQGVTLEDIAISLGGVAVSTVKRWIRLAEGPKPEQLDCVGGRPKRGRKAGAMLTLKEIRQRHMEKPPIPYGKGDEWGEGYRQALADVLKIEDE